jgi:hypothetical protein
MNLFHNTMLDQQYSVNTQTLAPDARMNEEISFEYIVQMNGEGVIIKL